MTKQKEHFAQKDPIKGLRTAAITLLTTVTLSACGPGSSSNSGDLTDKAAASVGCTGFEDTFWDKLEAIALSQKSFPNATDVRSAFEKSLGQPRLDGFSKSEKVQLGQSLGDLYQTIAVDAVRVLNNGAAPNASRTLEILTALELGDRSTPERDQLQTKIRAQFDRISTQAQGASTSCPATGGVAQSPVDAASTDANSLLGHWKATRPPAVFGGLKALATAYQSCEVGALKPIDASVGNVQGITITGTYSDGIGKIRKISDLAALLRTDYYLQNHRTPATTCFNVEKSPLIYNYGGKPKTSTDPDAVLDFFQQGGTGGKTLGIDCSAYVYSALATAGLKVKKTGRLKAIDVHGISSTMFNNPESNGLTCLSKAEFTASLTMKPGDIIAENGHVVLVESVGEDPFGINGFTTEAQCKASAISPARFDFTILQSSPVRNGIGINHMQASNYFSDGATMAKGVIDHAVTACLAKVRNGTIVTHSTHANLIRHSDSPDCFDAPVALNNESCLASCEAVGD